MSKQCLNIEQMQHLHDLGLDTSKASMQYIENNNGKILCVPKENEHDIKDVEDGFIICDALSLADILDLLPKELDTDAKRYNLDIWYGIYINKWCVGYVHGEYIYGDEIFMKDNLIDVAYEMLCWCIEGNYIEANKISA